MVQESLPGEYFCDAEGFAVVGARCALDTCQEHVFLPSKCRFCKAFFCQSHAFPSDHECKASTAEGIFASACPTCGDTIKHDAALQTEEQALEQHRMTCRGSPTRKERCPAEGCHTVLGLLNAVVCPRCRQRVCLAHRFADSHRCSVADRSGDIPAAVVIQPTMQKPEAIRKAPASDRPVTAPAAALSGELGQVPSRPASAGRPSVASLKELQELRRRLGGTTSSNGAFLYNARRLLSDILRAPLDLELRTLRKDAPGVREKLLAVRGAEALLCGIGFVDVGGETLRLPPDINKGRLELALRVLA